MSDELDKESSEALSAISQRLLKNLQNWENFTGASQNRARRDDRDNEKDVKSVRTRLKSLDSSLDNTEDRFRSLTSSGDGAISFLKNFANQGKGFLGMGLFTVMASRFNELSKTWQDLSNIGQTFGGSMFTMLQRAGEAGLSLDQFAEIAKRNNLVIRATGGGFWSMQKELRKAISASGSYGMTVEQINQFMGEQLDVSRRNGSLQSRSSRQVVKDMGELALTTSALATASDKTREQISELAAAAMSSSIAVAQMALTAPEVRGIVDKNMKIATMAFAALPGEAGDFFSKFFNDTFGSVAVATQQGQVAIEAGMSGVASDMDALAQKFRSGQGSIDDQIYFMNRFKDAYSAQLPMLKQQAAWGNQAAAQMINMGSQIEKTTRADLERRKQDFKNTETTTAFFASLNSMFGLLKGNFVAKFIEGFGKGFGKMEEFADSPVFKQITEVLGDMALAWGKSLGDTFRAIGPEGIKNAILGFVSGLATVAKVIVALSSFVGGVMTTIGGIVGSVGKVLSFFHVSALGAGKTLGMVFGGAWLINKVSKAFGLFRGMFQKSMTINAAVVNVNGGAGGGFGGGGGGKGGLGGRIKAGFRKGGFRGALGGGITGLGRGLKGVGKGGLGGLLGGAGRLVAPLGAALEAGDYIFGDKALSGKNLLKTGLAWGGGALGAIGGGLLTAGMGGEFVGGAAGYAGGSALGDWLLGDDDLKSAKPSDPKKTSAATAAAAGATAAGMIDPEMPSDDGALAGPDPQKQMLDEMRKNNDQMVEMQGILSAKLEQANRLLAKIEVSTQSMS